MTLAQLQSFVLVARHGSVKAAAAELEVTEPAVSVAVSALKRELGDELFVRSGRGIALTPGGRRLAALATEILGLAEQARRSVADSGGETRRLSVLATPLVAEHIGPMIELFSARDDGAGDHGRHRGRGRPSPRRSSTAAPTSRSGRRRARRRVGRLRPVPALPLHPRRRALAPARERRGRSRRPRWRVSAGSSARPSSTAARRPASFLARHGLAPEHVATYSSGAAAVAAAVAGEGIMLVLSHAVVEEVRRRSARAT